MLSIITLAVIIGMLTVCKNPASSPEPQGEQGLPIEIETGEQSEQGKQEEQGEQGVPGEGIGQGESGGSTPAHIHEWDDWTRTSDPTHTTEGVETRMCTLDPSHTETRSVAVLPALLEMIQINSGAFDMGSPETEPDRGVGETQHQVTLTAGFYMGKYPVTQEQYVRVMGSLPPLLDITYGKGEAFPVYFVSWYDAIVFCNKLSVIEGRNPAYSISGSTDPADWGTIPSTGNATWNAVQIVEGSNGYRLPTEAQWEYACRAGTTTAFNWGTGQITTDQANYNGAIAYNGSPTGVYRKKTTTVGSFNPNDLGLYDMHGNVAEWCWDLHGNYEGTQIDPTGAAEGTFRITRGGSWDAYGVNLRSASRATGTPSTRNNKTGFRVVWNGA